MIGSTIAKLRKQKKLTQAKFAEALHVTQAAVSQWETGRTKPDYQQLFILADFFGVTVEALSTGNMSAGVASENDTALVPAQEKAPANDPYYQQVMAKAKTMNVEELKRLLRIMDAVEEGR